MTNNDFYRAGRLLLEHNWIYAKTMPENPHEYTLRKHWNDADFVFVVNVIRQQGYRAMFKGRPYIQLNVNDHFYWTMGAPIGETILINRKLNPAPADYDPIAHQYDDLFCDVDSEQENQEIFERLGSLTNVLDIGCGTGLLLDHFKIPQYTGIDPSRKMLERLLVKHPEYHNRVIQTPFAGFVNERQYDLIVALFGAASYLSTEELNWIPRLLAPGGRYFLMFYADEYQPVTYQKTGVYLNHSRFASYPPGTVTRWHNFDLVEGEL